VTLSGIGEPLHNFAVVRDFLTGSPRPVSLTTSGGPPRHLEEALLLPHNGLMLSLHAASPALHRRLVPGAPDLPVLTAAVGRAWANLSRRRRRRFGVNYLLLAGINDGPDELDRLLELLRPWPEATLHLLVCNPVPESSFVSPPPAGVDAVYRYLADRRGTTPGGAGRKAGAAPWSSTPRKG
jgi:23S rRNA (adenine2503-C2)-methyltransferase